MRLRLSPFWSPKSGDEPNDYEDAFWPARSRTYSLGHMRCAIADGATESSFSGEWARLLVKEFGQGRIRAERLLDTLAPFQGVWRDTVGKKPLPWYAEQKRASGAFSSLLGLTMTAVPGGSEVNWSTMAVGDSCLFLVRADRLLVSFPIEAASDFDRSPHLICSVPRFNHALTTAVRCSSGTCRAGDTLYLMTDALAHWFLAAVEQGGRPWDVLEELVAGCTDTGFQNWLDIERTKRGVRNDDTTLLRLHLE